MGGPMGGAMGGAMGGTMGSGGVGSGLTGAIGGMLGGMGGVPQQMAMGGMPHMGGPGVGMMGNGMMGGGGMAPQVAPTGHPPMVGAGNTGHMLRGPGASQAGPGGAPSAAESEADAYARHMDGQLLTGLLCAALYPQIIAIEREETKKKKGINAPMKLRIRDKKDVSEEGAPEPTEVAIHPSSVNTKETKFNGMTYLIYHEKVRTTRVYVRDCSPVSAYALILFGGVLSSQPGAQPPLPPPTTSRKHRKHAPPPPPPRDGVLTIDGWIRFSVSTTEQALLVGVRSKLDALLASKIESPEMEILEASRELLAAVSQVLSAN